MVNAIKARGGTLPEDYVPKQKTGRRQRPRGEKRQHNNNNDAGSGGRKPKRASYSRKNAPQTGSTSGLGSS